MQFVVNFMPQLRSTRYKFSLVSIRVPVNNTEAKLIKLIK
jgi:hypothetical protein